MNHPRGCNLKVTRNNTVMHRHVEQIAHNLCIYLQITNNRKILMEIIMF